MTQEFLDTGRTENQRIHTGEQSKPKTGSIDDAADRFAESFLNENPEVNEMLQSKAPSLDLSDFTQSELRELAGYVEGSDTVLTVDQASQISNAIRRMQ